MGSSNSREALEQARIRARQRLEKYIEDRDQKSYDKHRAKYENLLRQDLPRLRKIYTEYFELFEASVRNTNRTCFIPKPDMLTDEMLSGQYQQMFVDAEKHVNEEVRMKLEILRSHLRLRMNGRYRRPLEHIAEDLRYIGY